MNRKALYITIDRQSDESIDAIYLRIPCTGDNTQRVETHAVTAFMDTNDCGEVLGIEVVGDWASEIYTQLHP